MSKSEALKSRTEFRKAHLTWCAFSGDELKRLHAGLSQLPGVDEIDTGLLKEIRKEITRRNQEELA